MSKDYMSYFLFLPVFLKNFGFLLIPDIIIIMKIVIPEYVEIVSDEYIRKLKKLAEVTVYADYPKTDEEIIRRIGRAELIAFNWIKINSRIIDRCPDLKYIITLSTGINFVDSNYASQKGIKVINCPTHNAQAVAEHIIALMLAISRNIVEAQTLIRKGRWKETPYMFTGTELSGKKLGLVGYGQIGKKVERLAKAMRMTVLYANSKTIPADLDKLVASSDYISLSLPYSEKTHHLIDERRLNLMKDTAYIINCARGGIIDQKMMTRFLKENKIAGAAIDVFENEPVDTVPSSDIIELVNLPNVIATPHIAFNTKEAAVRLGEELLKNVKACLAGKPINVKN